MYQESGNDEMFYVTIRCDRCSTFTELSGTFGRAFYMKLLVDLGWRVNSSARKYVHLCAKHAGQIISRDARRLAKV